MLTPWNIPCDAYTLCGQLKHSWLENQVRDIDADDIVMFWRDGLWSETVKKVFPHRLQQSQELTNRLADGFSPAQLVDQLAPLSKLSNDLQNKIKKAVHDTYLSTSDIESLEDPIRKAALVLEPEFSKLCELWEQPISIGHEIELRSCWENIRIKGKALHEQLEKLPRGVVFP